MADCECDIYDIYLEAQQRPSPADYVIRAKVDRCLPQRDLEADFAVYRKVRDEVAESKVRGTRTIHLPSTPRRKARDVIWEIRAIEVTIKPPHACGSLPAVTYNVVLVEEVNPPNDETAVS